MKSLGQSRSQRKYEENLRKSGGDDLYLQQARQAYYDSIPLEELFSYLLQVIQHLRINGNLVKLRDR